MTVRVTPRGARNELVGWTDGVLRVRVTAPPADGKANAAVLRVLGQRLAIPVRDLDIVAGAASRTKTIAVNGLTLAEVHARLNA